MLEKNIYEKRRKILKEKFENKIIIIMGNTTSPLDCKANNYPFIQDATFKYYFGVTHPDLVGVIDTKNNKEIIFAKDYTLDDIIWMGKQKYISEFAKDVGADFFDLDLLKDYISTFSLKDILFTNQYRADNEIFLSKLLNFDVHSFNDFISIDLIKKIIEQRSVKDELEIKLLEDAVNATVAMHEAAMKDVRAKLFEYELAAKVEAAAKENDCYMSFSTILSKNGQILHNHLHNNQLQDEDMVLLDCGAINKEGYCGDMTSTFPVSGKYSKRQKIIHNIVTAMFNKALELSKPGVTYKFVHLEVCRLMLEKFKELDLIKGDVQEALDLGVYALFMPHGLGHMLGMTVHDMENFGEDLVGYDEKIKRSEIFGLSSLRLGKELKEGYVLTIEPGIYFIPDLFYKWKEENKFIDFLNYDEIEKYLDFGGIRSERDIVITKDSCRILGRYLPRTADEIEEFMKK